MGILMLCMMGLLNSCVFRIQQMPSNNDEASIEYKIMMSTFDKETQLIIKAFEKSNQDPFVIARMLKDSKSSSLEGFILYLKTELYKELSTTSEMLDKEIFDIVRENYNLLKEMVEQGYDLLKNHLIMK